MPLPAELEVLLQAHGGQHVRAAWWPTLDCGSVLGRDRITEYLTRSRATTEAWQWSQAWIPVAQE